MSETRHSMMQARFLVAFFFAALLAAAGMAPFLAGNGQKLGASLLYLIFAPVCHQLPERCFALYGHPWGLCHRCCGLYAGIVAAVVVTAGRRLEAIAARHRRKLALWTTAALTADALLPYLGIWTNSPFSRFSTGLVFGGMLGSLLVPAVSELLARWHLWHECPLLPDTRGGV